jgi:L(+)-tartrate dehydratase alpha subunit
MKHPLTGYDPGNNIGMNIPDFTYKFVEGNSLEISYAAKGGGSECFGGTRHRIVAFADGVAGIEKFVIDSFVASARAGAVCPPSVLGIGIGGTANVAANLAKEAACLRTVGSKHPDPMFRKIEEDLYEALNSLDIGILGAGGSTSVLAVNVEYAYTHIAGIACATSTNCMVARRASTRILGDGSVEMMKSPMWFGDR